MSIPILNSEPLPPDGSTERLKRLLIILATMAIGVAAIYSVKIVWPIVQWLFSVLAPFLIGLVLAYIFNPLVNLIQRKFNLGRGAALGIVVLLLILLFTSFIGLITYLVFQLDDAYAYISENWAPAYYRVRDLLSPYINIAYLDKAQQYLQDIDWQNVAASVLPRVGQGTWGVAQGIAMGLGFFISIVILTIFVVITCFYYLLDFHKIPRIARIIIPDEREGRLFQLFNRVDEAVGGFLRGQLLDCLAVGVLVTIMMLIWGPRNWALLIGAIAGLVNFIPYLGPAAGATPAILWALFTPTLEGMSERMFKVLYLVLAFWAVQLVDNWILQPKIVGKHAQLHPLAVLLALFVGAHFGLAGMFVAVPTACIVRVLIKELWWDKLAEDDHQRQLRAMEKG